MLKKRIILSLCINNGQLYRTKWFRPDRWYTLNFVDLDLADEIVLLDVTRHPGDGPPSLDDIAWRARREKFWTTVRDFSRELFLPLSVGGWIRSMEDVRRAFAEGADKVVLNTAVRTAPEFLSAVAAKYGRQAVVVSVDVRDGCVVTEQGAAVVGDCPSVAAWCSMAVALGAGEILLMDVQRDGSLQGYNLELIREVSAAVRVPVIAVGGMGCWRHAEEGFAAGADACATQVIHHLTATSLRACKSYLHEKGVPVRT